jgi:hypothetical protein
MIGGTGQNSGLLGTGQYRQDPYSIDRSAFDANPEEQQLIEALKKQAYGGQNIALQTGLDQASKQAQAIAASQRGINPAMAARLAANAQSDLAQQANIAGVQLQQQGVNNLANQLGSLRQSRQNREALVSGNNNANNQTNAQAYEGAAGRRQGLLQGIGSALATGGMAHGGMVQGYAEGGAVDPFFAQQLQNINQPFQLQTKQQKPMDMGAFAKMLKSQGGGSGGLAGGPMDNMGGIGGAGTMVAAQGGVVPGVPEVEGDHPANDKVPAVLSPGEIVIPRTVVAKGPDAAKRFVQAILKRG